MLADQSVVRMMSLSSGPDSKMVLQTFGQALPLLSFTCVVPIRRQVCLRGLTLLSFSRSHYAQGIVVAFSTLTNKE